MTPAAAAASGELDIEPIYYEARKTDVGFPTRACYDVRVVQGVIALLFDESSSFTAPAAFGTYRVLHQVGSGVLGPVFRTSDPRRPELVAVKAFKLDLRPDEVVRLADALRRLAAAPPVHPSLISIVDAGLEGTTPFLATEYLIGDTLDVLLRRRAPLPLAEALRLLTPVAAALDAAWSAGVGHGALHPRDVFVRPDLPDVKVTGVGITQALEGAGLAAPVRRPYTAPERTGKDWNHRADVYSLAVVAHELLTGRRPAGPTEQDGIFASDVTPEQRVAIRRVLGRALAEDPDERFASNRAFLETLAAVAVAGTVGRPAAVPVIDPGFDVGDPAPDIADEATRQSGADAPVATLLADHLMAGVDVDLAGGASAEAPPLSEPVTPRAGLRLDVPIDDLAYRPVQETSPLLDELRPAAGAVPAWLPDSGAPAPSRGTRWGAVVVMCLIVGGGVGYLAGVYDPLADVGPSRLADRGPAVGADPADDEASPDVPTAPTAPPVEPALPPESPSAAPEPPTPRPASARRPDVVPAAAPASPAGALQVRSDPSGAMVTLDGRLVGETPLVLRHLTAGPYLLQVARPGYAPHSERVTIPSGGSERTVQVALEAAVTLPATGFGAIQVDSEPRGARVMVDGRFVGQSPLRVPELRPGPHTVTLELANHSSVTRRTVVEPGRTARVIVNLR